MCNYHGFLDYFGCEGVKQNIVTLAAEVMVQGGRNKVLQQSLCWFPGNIYVWFFPRDVFLKCFEESSELDF